MLAMRSFRAARAETPTSSAIGETLLWELLVLATLAPECFRCIYCKMPMFHARSCVSTLAQHLKLRPTLAQSGSALHAKLLASRISATALTCAEGSVTSAGMMTFECRTRISELGRQTHMAGTPMTMVASVCLSCCSATSEN